MFCLSKIVTSDQKGVHDSLGDLVKKNKASVFRKPFSTESLKCFCEIEQWIESKLNRSIVLDLGCGVGESTYHLALKYTQSLVIGIDKSQDRILRKNKFKQNLPDNCFIVRGDIIDLLRLFKEQQNKYQFTKIYILYPNPYPKQKHLKLRWHGHSIFKTMMGMGAAIEVRSNWNTYVEEFEFAAQLYDSWESKLEEFVPEKTVTPFERKYHHSEHRLFRLQLFKR